MAALAAIGSLVGAVGTIAAGKAAKKDQDFQAVQLDQKANEERASATRVAAQSRNEAALVDSRAQALAASSGGGAGTDAPTIVKLMSGIAGQGELNAQTNLYTGFSRGAGLNDQASAARRSGKASLLGSYLNAFGQAAGGLGKASTSGAFG